MATLRLTRAPKGRADRLRAYRVVVDGEPVARIKPGESRDIAVQPGSRRICMKMDWVRSRVLQLTISAGEVISVRCYDRMNPLLWPYWATFGRKSYIGLEVTVEDSASHKMYRTAAGVQGVAWGPRPTFARDDKGRPVRWARRVLTVSELRCP